MRLGLENLQVCSITPHGGAVRAQDFSQGSYGVVFYNRCLEKQSGGGIASGHVAPLGWGWLSEELPSRAS
jgi:hypothetical protein